MNFLENLPGGRAGEANRSDPQSRVSRLIPVNVPAQVLVPEKPLLALGFRGLGSARPRVRERMRARGHLRGGEKPYVTLEKLRGCGVGSGPHQTSEGGTSSVLSELWD